EKEALVLAHDPPREQQDVFPRPDDSAGIDVEPDLLHELAPDRRTLVLAVVDAAARRDPPDVTRDGMLPTQQEHPVRGVDDERARCEARVRLEPVAQRAKPAQTLVVGHRRVRGRRRRQDEEAGVLERAQLRSELGPLAEHTAIRLLADKGDRTRPQLEHERLEAGAIEVAAPEIA